MLEYFGWTPDGAVSKMFFINKLMANLILPAKAGIINALLIKCTF